MGKFSAIKHLGITIDESGSLSTQSNITPITLAMEGISYTLSTHNICSHGPWAWTIRKVSPQPAVSTFTRSKTSPLQKNNYKKSDQQFSDLPGLDERLELISPVFDLTLPMIEFASPSSMEVLQFLIQSFRHKL